MSPEGEGSHSGQKQQPQPRFETDQKARSALASTIGTLFNIIGKVVAGTTAHSAGPVSKRREEMRNAFRTAARFILGRLPRPFSGLLRLPNTRRIMPDESAPALEPDRHANSKYRVEDHRQRPRRLGL
jgi:hypothetical protein